MKRSHLVFAVLVCALLYAAMLATRRLQPAFPGLTATTEGAFQPNGQYPGEPIAHADGIRLWGSWAGSDANTGALAFGPFPAPKLLRFAVSGYPLQAGIQLYLEDVATKARLPIKVNFNIGEKWSVVDYRLPPDWIGLDWKTDYAQRARRHEGPRRLGRNFRTDPRRPWLGQRRVV